jgi:Protein of unknown function (DUF3106)
MSLLWIVLSLLLYAEPLWAQPEPSGIPWSQLSSDEQVLLERFRDKWDRMPPQKQKRLLNGGEAMGRDDAGRTTGGHKAVSTMASIAA